MPRPSPETWQTISHLLDQVLDLAPADRPAWLEALRGRDARAAGLLDAWLHELEAADAGRFMADPPAASKTPAAGLEVGAYRLTAPLGHGGMGTVWLAERRDGQFDQRVAVKLLNAALVDTAAAERFSREAGILARLTHPSISRLLDAGVSPMGAPYLVLEYVDGIHIDAECDRRRLPIEERLYLFLDVLAPVAHAHANLIVHRDLKPANVLVTPAGHVKLLDFGIAKLLSSGADTPTVSGTRDGALTPAFAAPEQLTGGAVTTATDVYALGVLLYLLLTGRHPSLDGTVTPAALIEAVVHREPPRASDVVRTAAADGTSPDTAAATRRTTPARLSQALAGDLDTILGKALKKAPAERYATVAALEDDLRRYLRHQPIAARPDTAGYRLAKFVRRHRAPVAFAAVAVAALVAGLAGTLTQARRATAQAARADRQAAEATAQRDYARKQLVRAEAINDLNAFLLADAAPVGSTFTARDLLDRAAAIVARQGDDAEGARIESIISIGSLYGNVGETAKAVALLRQAHELAMRQPDPELRASASCALGNDLVKTGDIAGARRHIDQGLSMLPAEPQYGLMRARCHLDGSGVEMWAGDGTRAVAHVVEARREAEASGTVSPLLALKQELQLAEALRIADRDEEASRAFASAHERLLALGREDTERAGTLLNNWGLLLGAMGRPLEAERMLRRSIEIGMAGGSDARIEPISWANLARARYDLGRYAEAVPLAERAMRRAREQGDTVVANQAQLMAARANLLAGHVARAAALLDDVEARFRAMFPPSHPALVAVALDRVRLATERGALGTAARLADEVVTQVSGDPRHAGSVPVALRLRADVHLRARRFAEARRDAERMVALTAGARPDALSTQAGVSYLTLGEALAGEGRTAEARAAADQALRHLADAAGPGHPSTQRARALRGRL